LVELIHTELEYRLKAGERDLAGDYLARYPELAADRAAAVGLILAEHQLRRRLGPEIPADELLRRFPAYRNELAMCLGASDGPHVPGYEIVGELGRGGMGVVYKARQVALKRLVALKMIRAAGADAEERARFRAEAEAVARLQHPNIVQVFDVGEHQGSPF